MLTESRRIACVGLSSDRHSAKGGSTGCTPRTPIRPVTRQADCWDRETRFLSLLLNNWVYGRWRSYSHTHTAVMSMKAVLAVLAEAIQ